MDPLIIDQPTAALVPADAAELPARRDPLPPAEHPAWVYLFSLGENDGRRSMRTCLENVAAMISGGAANVDTFPWERLTFAHAAAIRSRLQGHVSERSGKPLSPASVNKHLAALRGVVTAAWDLGYIPADDAARIKRALKNVNGSSELAGRNLSSGEVSALMRACQEDQTPAGVRDAALIAVSASVGPRRTELIRLDVEDVVPEEDGSGQVRIRLFGKGNKARTVFVDNGAADALRDWIRIRGDQPGPFFVPVNKSGVLTIRRLTAQAVYALENKRREQAGVRDFSPHDLRRTTAGDLLDAGVDLPTVQAILGHASPTTTARYDRRGDRAKRKAASCIHVPYQRMTVR